jgi:hypothetical protein
MISPSSAASAGCASTTNDTGRSPFLSPPPSLPHSHRRRLYPKGRHRRSSPPRPSRPFGYNRVERNRVGGPQLSGDSIAAPIPLGADAFIDQRHSLDSRSDFPGRDLLSARSPTPITTTFSAPVSSRRRDSLSHPLKVVVSDPIVASSPHIGLRTIVDGTQISPLRSLLSMAALVIITGGAAGVAWGSQPGRSPGPGWQRSASRSGSPSASNSARSPPWRSWACSCSSSG